MRTSDVYVIYWLIYWLLSNAYILRGLVSGHPSIPRFGRVRGPDVAGCTEFTVGVVKTNALSIFGDRVYFLKKKYTNGTTSLPVFIQGFS